MALWFTLWVLEKDAPSSIPKINFGNELNWLSVLGRAPNSGNMVFIIQEFSQFKTRLFIYMKIWS